jgi:hypothetical protein
MATVIKLKIQVAELDNVLTKFDQIKVYRSTTGIAGAYSELTVAATRIPLVQGKTEYEFDDVAGEINYFYKTSYFHSGTSLESNQSPPRLGDDPATANIMTVSELKDIFLFGIDLTNDAGDPFPDLMFEWAIRWAIGWLERQLDIRIREESFVQRYDYYFEDYTRWMALQLREFPAIAINSIKVKWPSDTTVIEFPSDWIRLRADAGQVNVIPTSGTLGQYIITEGGSFLPLIATKQDFIPDILEIDYTAGFAEGEVPIELRDLIGKAASFHPLNVAGDLIVGAGIASKSISIDGLSQSINTTSSATNAGYGARIVQYTKEIKAQLPVLRKYYKGFQLTALG